MFKIAFSLFMQGIRWELPCFLCTDTVQSTIGSFSFLCIWKTRDILWKTLPVETETLLILQKTKVHKNWLNWLPVFFNRQLEGWGGKKGAKEASDCQSVCIYQEMFLYVHFSSCENRSYSKRHFKMLLFFSTHFRHIKSDVLYFQQQR